MKCLIYFLSILMLSGCSAEWHLSKAIGKNPSLLKQKTITVTDTIVLPSVELRDTVLLKAVDTITLVKDRFRVKIMRSFDTLVIDGGCDSDTIVRYVNVDVPVIEYVKENKFWKNVYRVSFYVLLVAIISFILKGFINKNFS